MYGLAKSTFSLRSSVTVKLASVMSTLLDVSTSTRAAGSTDVYLTFTPRSLARRSAKTMSYEVLAWAKINKGFKVGITKLGDEDTIAPAVQKGNKVLLNWINDEIVKLGKENFFHKDYEETLKPVYGSDVNPDDIVVEGGQL